MIKFKHLNKMISINQIIEITFNFKLKQFVLKHIDLVC